MLTRSFRGYGAVTDSEYESVQSLVGQLNNAINTAKQVLTGLVAGCASIDPQLSTRILDVESFIETRVKPAIDDWQNGVVLFDTIRGYIDDEVAVLDDLVAKMNAYGCATGVLANGQIGQRPELASGGGGGGGGASSGGGGGGGGTTGIRPVTPYTPPGPVQAGLGSLGWLGALAVVGYIIYDKYYKKGTKKGRSKRTTRKMPVRRRRA